MTPRTRLLALAGLPALLWSGGAAAQSASANYLYADDTAIIRPAIPEGFDRGRNESVLEHPTPDYQPVGIPISSFIALPRVDVAAGGTSNVFLLNGAARRGSAYTTIVPTLNVNSDWSRHKLQFNGALDYQHYFGNSRRDQTNYTVGAKGNLEIGTAFTLAGEVDGSRQFESPFSGGVQSAVAVLSSYKSSFGSVRGTYEGGRIRAILSVDHTTLDYASLDFGGGVVRSQRDRDRDLTRFSGQVEFAFSPSVSLYTQAAVDDISYDTRLLNGDPNRDSKGFRVSGGANIDIAGLARGTLAVGYVRRNFDAARYKTVDGPSVEATVTFFPSYLTNVTLRVRRFLEDSSLGGNNAPFFDNRVTLGVDHALLRNLILQASGSYGHLQYRDNTSGNRDTYRFTAGATYQATRRYGLRGNIGYGRQTAGNLNSGRSFSEVRGQIGFYVQR